MQLTEVADSFTKFNELLGKYMAGYNCRSHTEERFCAGLCTH